MPPTVLSKPVKEPDVAEKRVEEEAASDSPAAQQKQTTPAPVSSKPEKEVPSEPAKGLDALTQRVFNESIAAVKKSFPEWSSMPVHHAALHAYIESTQAIRDAWPLTPRAALHALGFSLRDVRRILGYGTDGGVDEHDVKGREEALQIRRLVALLAKMTEDDFPAALRWVWEARARLWEWTGGVVVEERKRKKKKKNVGGKMGEGTKEEKKKEEAGDMETEEEDMKETAGEKTRVKRRMRPKLMPRYCGPDNIKIAIILARRELKKQRKDQEEKEARKDEDWPEEEQRDEMRAARYLAMEDALRNKDGPEDDVPEEDNSSLLGGLLATGTNLAGCCGDRKKGRDSATKQQTPEGEAGASVSEEDGKDRKDSKPQPEGSSTDATKPSSTEKATVQEDEDATMNAIMAAAQELGDPSLTEDGPSSLTFDTTRFTDQLLATMGLTRRHPPLHLDRRSKRFLPTAAQNLLHTPAKLHRHFYHARSDVQLMVEMTANYTRREALWQEYLADCINADKMPLSKKEWAQSQGVSLQQALFGDVVDGALCPDCCWDDVRDCMQGVAESWQGVWESHLRRAWGEFAVARADEVFERTDRA